MPTCPTCRTKYSASATRCAKDDDLLLPDEAFTGVDAPLEEGRVVGEYRIEGKIGAGGFGTVYRAVHPLIGKAAAIKVLGRQYSADPQMVARFIAEARAVNQIRHRHIIDIFSFGSLEDGRQYFVMELLEGMTLDAFLQRRGRLSPEEALPILRAIARALDAAHSRDIAHRDLKPENVFLAMQDGEIFPKLLDFGIAKLMGKQAGSGGMKTSTGAPIGTPHYMSPEQCRGREIDHKTDIYSFGIMAHQVLTGKLPFSGGDIMELLVKQVSAPAPPVSRVCPDLPPALDAPILAMLEKDPKRRPATVGLAVEALFRAAHSAGCAVSLLPPGGDSGGRLVMPPEGSVPRGLGEATTVGATPVLAVGTLQGTTQGTTAEGAGVLVERRTRRMWLAGGGLLATAVGLGALAVYKRPAPVAVTPSAPPQVSASAPIAPESAPAAAKVKLKIESEPSGATVMRGVEVLGTTPLDLSVERGIEKIPLTVSLDGYVPKPVDLEPTNDRHIRVPLVAKATAPAARPGDAPRAVPTHQDMEKNPYGKR